MSYKKEAQLQNLEWMGNELIKIASNKSLSLIEELNQLENLKKAYLDKKSIMINVFKQEWEVVPHWAEGDIFKGYDVYDQNGRKVMRIAPQNGKQMNKEMLEYTIGTELTRGTRKAILREDVAFLKKGSQVLILASDKAKGRVKFADLAAGVRGWISSSKVQLEALESQTVQHNGHSCKVLGQTATETLLDCVEGGPVWISAKDLLYANRPPATPESLNLEEAKKEVNEYWCRDCEMPFFPKRKDEHKGHDIVEAPKKEALKTALPPATPDQRAYLDNPVEKKAEKCPICEQDVDAHDPAKCEERIQMSRRTRTMPEIPQDKVSDVEKESASNMDVINLFVNDSFPKDKMPTWGSANLKISKQPNGWALINYQTPIAYRPNGGDLYLNSDKYSVTTSKIQTQITQAAGGQVKAMPESELRMVMSQPVEKTAAGCDSCSSSMINGVFCHESGCPKAPKKCRHGKMSDVCSVCSDPFEDEGTELESSLNKKADYEGWSNFDTWGLALWLDNDQELYNQSREMAKNHSDNESLAAELAATYNGLLEEKGEEGKSSDKVNWNEIANDLLNEVKENEAYEKSEGAGGVIEKLPVVNVEEEKNKLIDQLAKETDPEKKKSLERRYKHLTMASLNKQARVVHHKDGWHVLSEKGKNLGGPYATKGEAVKRLRQVEYFKHHGSKKPFSKKEAEVLVDPYQALQTHVDNMRQRMIQVQEKIQTQPVPKLAGEEEKDNSSMDLATVFEDLTMGIDLLETKLKDAPESEELHKGLEELENLLWEVEMKAGITPKLSEEEKAEPEHKEIMKEVEKEASANEWPLCSVEGCNNKADSVGTEDSKRYCYTHSWGHKQKMKEAALPVAIAPTLSNPAPTDNATPAPAVTPDDKKTSCALCGGMTFPDFTAYQQHMEYTHAGDTMPTTPAQKNLPTTAASKKVAEEDIMEWGKCKGCGERKNLVPLTDLCKGCQTVKKDAAIPVATPAPVIKNVNPTDADNLEVPTQMPTSPLPPGQKWVWDAANGKYVAMTDSSQPGKTI